jgi:hypothetical protein
MMQIYEARGNISDADCIIGNSFGTSTGDGSVNEHLGHQMLFLAQNRPMIADRTLVDAMPNGESRMAHTVDGPVTNMKVQGVGTWGTLREAQRFMEENDLHSPLMIAQAYHISRVVRQATKLGLHAIVPEGLPKEFDKNSDQIWTRSPYLWIPFNGLGSLLLKKRGQL